MLLGQISNAWRYKGSRWKEESVQNLDDDRDDDGEEEEKKTLMVVVVAASANMTVYFLCFEHHVKRGLYVQAESPLQFLVIHTGPSLL